MRTERRFTIKTEPCGDAYRLLLSVGAEVCATLTLVVRADGGFAARGYPVLEKLGAYLLDTEATDEWPGTRLLDSVVCLHRYLMAPEVLTVLCAATDRLYGWKSPDLPEDLCLYRSDREVWLATIAHERDGYLLLTNDELTRVQEAIPSLLLQAE